MNNSGTNSDECLTTTRSRTASPRCCASTQTFTSSRTRGACCDEYMQSRLWFRRSHYIQNKHQTQLPRQAPPGAQGRAVPPPHRPWVRYFIAFCCAVQMVDTLSLTTFPQTPKNAQLLRRAQPDAAHGRRDLGPAAASRRGESFGSINALVRLKPTQYTFLGVCPRAAGGGPRRPTAHALVGGGAGKFKCMVGAKSGGRPEVLM